MNEQKECIQVKLTCGVDYYKGEKPVKGVDYFTEEDIREIAEYIETEGIDLTDYATKEYVDNAIDNIPASPTYEAGYGIDINAGTISVDSGVIASHTWVDEEIPNVVPAWALQGVKPTYTAQEVGALPANTSLFSGDYEDLTNKPTIPTVPTNVSAFTNDAGYLTSHQSLTDYATKSYVEQVVAGIETGMLKRSVVQALPTQDIDSNTIYMVPRVAEDLVNNVYDEYLYVNNSWEKIGSTDVDLTGYATESYVASAIAAIPSTTYTFTNGLSESNGTVSWDLSDRIAATARTGAVIIGGISSTTNNGVCSLAEGINNTIYGNYSHAEGEVNTINASNAHAEGASNTVNGKYSHAEGRSNTIQGEVAHAEGYYNTAAGAYTHVEGQYNNAHNGQHVEGKFNQEDSNYVFQHIAGNGANAVSRSNAYALGRDGNGYYSGNLYVGCNDYSTTSVNSAGQLITANAGGSKVATESYVASAISAIPSTTYTLPVSTTSTLGGVKIDGSSITIDNNGVISANAPTYTLPTATTAVLGGVKVDGSTITIDSNGIISTTGTFSGDYNDLTNKPTIPAAYTLPTATTATLGGVMVDGSSIVIDGNGVISTTATGGSSYTFTDGLNESNGTVSWNLNDRIKVGTGDYSLIFGNYNLSKATKKNAVCFGEAQATGVNSLAQGGGLAQATGTGSVAMGFGAIASGEYSHAEGDETNATGQYSHAEGIFTYAMSVGQHAEGKYNVKDAYSVFLHIVGNGTANGSRSNASALDWSGNQFLGGNLYVNCSDFTTTSTGLITTNCGGSKVATEAYVDSKIPTAPSTDGTYFLTSTISSGTATYSWENVVIGGSY